MTGGWNYRVVEKEYFVNNEISLDYTIHEVYYYPDGSIRGYSNNPITPLGADNPDELKFDLTHMLEAFDKPVLKWKQLEKMFRNATR
jgi:hypothetical protein